MKKILVITLLIMSGSALATDNCWNQAHQCFSSCNIYDQECKQQCIKQSQKCACDGETQGQLCRYSNGHTDVPGRCVHDEAIQSLSCQQTAE